MEINYKNTLLKIQNETTSLHYHWILYRQLFGTNDKRIGVLNITAPSFFRAVHNVLFYYVELRLVCLSGPAHIKGKKTTSIELLIEHIESSKNHENNIQYLKRSLVELRKLTKKFETRRNNFIAHLNHEKSKLPEVSRADVEAALSKLREIINSIEIIETGTPMAYEMMIVNDGDILIDHLNKSLKYIELVKSGKLKGLGWESEPNKHLTNHSS